MVEYFCDYLVTQNHLNVQEEGDECHMPRVVAQCMLRTPLWCMSAAIHLTCTFESRHFSLKHLC